MMEDPRPSSGTPDQTVEDYENQDMKLKHI